MRDSFPMICHELAKRHRRAGRLRDATDRRRSRSSAWSSADATNGGRGDECLGGDSLALTKSLVIREEEGAVLLDRTADGTAELVAHEVRLGVAVRVIDEIGGVQNFVAEELIQVAV